MSHEQLAVSINGNLGEFLRRQSRSFPEKSALLHPVKISFSELDRRVDQLANGFSQIGIKKGSRVIMLVKNNPDFYIITFALMRMSAVPVLIDPGVGHKVMKNKLAGVSADAFIGIPKAHLFRLLYRLSFKDIKIIITVGRRWFWSGYSLKYLFSRKEKPYPAPSVEATETGGIFFTSGSTGPPKGVIYQNSMFHAQISFFKTHYKWSPEETDLCTFPLIGLFSLCLGVSVVIADLNPVKPSSLNPEKIWKNLEEYNCSHMFASPMIVKKLAAYGHQQGLKLSHLKRIVSAGAPVPPDLLRNMKSLLSELAEIHTPYGATEALPVSDACDTDLLAITGSNPFLKGICVGKPLPGMRVRIVKIDDGIIKHLKDKNILPDNQIGEIIVNGPVVTHEYLNNEEANKMAKITDESNSLWHRMGDLGRMDESGRLWFYGRKNHRVETKTGRLYTITTEALFNQHPLVERSALVGIHPDKNGIKEAVICIEPAKKLSAKSKSLLINDLEKIIDQNSEVKAISAFLITGEFPVDPRHNAKIFREKLSRLASRKIS
ncbi:MAG: AMP-binding protein [Bacteroidetes bacterium]|nr:AMP-binding protein [Bacteroidota bacterium]